MMALARAGHAWRLGDLIDGLIDQVAVPGHLLDRPISDLVLDSCRVTPGALLLACQGVSLHELELADEAVRRGVALIIGEVSPDWPVERIVDLATCLGLPIIPVERLRACLSPISHRFYGSPSTRMDVLGVCEGLGEGVFSHLLAQVLDRERPCGIIGPAGSGLLGQLRSAPVEPDALALQSTLDDLLSRGARAVALTMSPRVLLGEQAAAVRLTHLVFTRLAPGSSADAAIPTVTLDALGGRPGLEWVVLNLDDSLQARLLVGRSASVRLAGYSLTPGAPMPDGGDLLLRALAVETMAQGLRVEVECLGGLGREHAVVEVGLIGRSNAADVLAVLTVMRSRGLPLERAAYALSQVRGVPGRMECFGGERTPLVVVDSARSPEDLERALRDLRLHRCRRVVTVVGCDCDRDPRERPRLGAVAEQLSDAVILTDDNPRGPSGDAIIAGLLSGMLSPNGVRVERQRGLAIRIAIALAGVGDAVLVAGKGDETVQDMGDLKVHFSDRAQVVEALREWREGHH